MRNFSSETAARLLYIHMNEVTHKAPRRRKQRYGKSLSLALFLLSAAAVVFGRGMA